MSRSLFRKLHSASPPIFVAMSLAGLIAFFALAACGSDAEPEPDAAIPDPVGTFSASWAVSDGASTVNCAAVGADSVRIRAIEVNAAFGTVVGFGCDETSGTSRNLDAGTYRLEFDLRTGNGQSLLAAPIRVEDVVIEIGGNTTVEPQTFSVIPSGSLSFRLASANAPMGNCAAEVDNGAGIQEFQFNLRNTSMVCVPTTFEISDGALPGGTYTSDCTEANRFPCIGADQTVTVDPAAAGPRLLEILGITEAGLPCRRHLAQYDQPGNNLERDLTELGLQINNAVAECVP